MKNKLAWAALALAVVTGTSGLAAAQDGRYNDRDDNRYYDRDDDRYNDRDGYRYDSYGRGLNVARDFGFRDGSQVAREDMWNRNRSIPIRAAVTMMPTMATAAS